MLVDTFTLRRAAVDAGGFEATVFRDFPLGGLVDGTRDGLEDFLRFFVDIRLPFVAFRGSTNRVLRGVPMTAGFGPVFGLA
ncbi:hypothetical protein [Bradyrhizobium sp.]|uniref:hypothetical protein n=1 Tax=Bradyrhizobium sp. TaxID=376 RepID=UPI00344EEEA7